MYNDSYIVVCCRAASSQSSNVHLSMVNSIRCTVPHEWINWMNEALPESQSHCWHCCYQLKITVLAHSPVKTDMTGVTEVQCRRLQTQWIYVDHTQCNMCTYIEYRSKTAECHSQDILTDEGQDQGYKFQVQHHSVKTKTNTSHTKTKTRCQDRHHINANK